MSPPAEPERGGVSAHRIAPGRVHPGGANGTMAAKAALSEVDTALSDLHTWRRDHERRVRETRERLESASRGLEEEDRERREAEEAVQAAEAALAEIDAELARSRDEERQRAEQAILARLEAGAQTERPAALSAAQVRMLGGAGSFASAGRAASAAVKQEVAPPAPAPRTALVGAAKEGEDEQDEDALLAEVDALIEGYRSDDGEGGEGRAGAGAASALDSWAAELDGVLSLIKNEAAVGMALATEAKEGNATDEGA